MEDTKEITEEYFRLKKEHDKHKATTEARIDRLVEDNLKMTKKYD